MVKSLLFGLAFGSVGTLVAMQYHFVRTDERFVIVSRAHQPPLRSVYVDIRDWNTAMWEHYPELQEAIVKAGRQDLLTARSSTAKNLDSAIPFQGVSRTGETPIFTASEARSAPTPPSPKSALPPEASNSIQSPRVALGTSTATKSMFSESLSEPTMSEPTTTIKENPASQPAPHSTLTDLPVTAESLLHSMQRTVPQPEEIVPSAVAGRLTKPVPEVVAETLKQGPKPDWVQSLLRTIVPGASGSTESAFDEPAARAQSVLNAETPASPPLQKSVGPLQQIIPQRLPSVSPVPPTEDSAFPATPRRIDATGVLEI